jgi:DNA-binding SARP family transcriptional activator/DNA-binding beta-propeller fold protein YncE
MPSRRSELGNGWPVVLTLTPLGLNHFLLTRWLSRATKATTMDFSILGPLEVRDGGRSLELRPRKQRVLLAVLLLCPGEPVSADQLLDDLWGDCPPPTARDSLHNLVCALRKLLGKSLLRTVGQGYLLDVEREQVDLFRFERLLEEARSAISPHERSQRLCEALALWRGPPLADLAFEPFVIREAPRLAELELGAREEFVEARLALGEHAELIPELEALVGQHPYNERLRGQLILALYRSGRQTEALDSYRITRKTLVDELGLEPSAELRQLQQAILRQEGSLLQAPMRVTWTGSADAPPSTPREEKSQHPARGIAVQPFARRHRRAVRAAVTWLCVAAGLAALVLTLSGFAQTAGPAVTRNSLVQFDAQTGKVKRVIKVGRQPEIVSLTPRAAWVYSDSGTYSRVDRRTGRVSRVVGSNECDSGFGVDGAGNLWVARDCLSRSSSLSRVGRVYQFDPWNGRQLRVIRLHRLVGQLVVAGNSVWLTGLVRPGIAERPLLIRMDVRSGKVVRRVPLKGDRLLSISVSPVYLYALTLHGRRVRVTTVSRATGRVLRSLVVSWRFRLPGGFTFAAGSFWVTDLLGRSVVRVDPSDGRVQDRIRVGRVPTGVAPAGKSVWVVNGNDGTLSRIDPQRKREKTLRFNGTAPLALVGDGRSLWVTYGRGTCLYIPRTRCHGRRL